MQQPLAAKPRGRPGRYSKYDNLLQSLPALMVKRPLYCDQIGLFRGRRGVTAWVKIRLQGGKSQEFKLGALESWTWEQLEAKRNDLQGRADRGEPIEPAPLVTFQSHSADWLDRKKSTVKGHDIMRGHVAKHLLPTFGKKPLATISTADINRWIADQRKALKPATVQRQFATLNAILNDALRSGIIERNPAALCDPIRGVEARARFLAMDELQKVLATARDIEATDNAAAESKPHQKRGWLADFVLWTVHSGMRRQEVLNLRWHHIQKVDDDLVLVEIPTSKSGKPRKITCNNDMLSILERLRGLHRQPGDDRLFPVSLTTAKRKLTKLWRATGLNDVRLHDLRRTHASVLVKNGIDMRTVAERLGHRDISMLMQHYSVFLGDADATNAAQRAFSMLS